MGSTHFSHHYHMVFGTKGRGPFIRSAWRNRLHDYLGGTVRGLDGVSEIIGGVEDHVHLLVCLRATHCQADFLRELKKRHRSGRAQAEPDFAWQDSYADFTASVTATGASRRYIANQEQQRRRFEFREELETLLEPAGVEYDPQYLE